MSTRAQTNVDFLIGMSVFLLAVGFVFGLVPDLFEPFAVDGGSKALVADRAAARLVEGLLASPGEPAVLDATCTEAFFAGTVPAGCQFATADLDDALGLDATTRANVTIERDGEIRTLGGTRLAAGPTPPEGSADVVVARRVVLLDGELDQVYVRTW